MSRSEPLRAIVVGAGLMGRWHAAAAARSGARVTAVVDPDLARARALAARYADCAARSDLASVLAQRSAHVVHLCTPAATHEDLADRAIRAGCHILVEKPVASTLAVTRRLVDLAAAQRVLLCPCHQFLFQRGVLRACAVLPELGRVRHVDVVTCSAGAEGRSDEGRDEVAFDILPHPFSLLVRLLAFGWTEMDWHVWHPAPGELRLAGASHGATAGITISMGGRPAVNSLRIVAELGTVHCDLFHGYATVERGTVSRARKIARPFSTATDHLLSATANLGWRVFTREFAYPGLRELMRRFYRAVGAGGVSPIGADETLAVAEARDAVLAAMRTR